jgi:DNA processing protein
MHTEIIDYLALSFFKAKGIDTCTIIKWLHHFEHANLVLNASVAELAEVLGKIPFVADEDWQRNVALAYQKAEEEFQHIKTQGIQAVCFADAAYPSFLKHCPDAPIVLYYKGTLAALNERANLSIVGTRKASHYGIKQTENIVQALSAYKVNIISGLAQGIDQHAHLCALEAELPTFGVLGHGLQQINPASSREIAQKMQKQGAVLTEFPWGFPASVYSFPLRNRIVAGISEATILIESAIDGGGMITARLSGEYNRETFALPARLDDELSQGCLALIAQNKARCFTSIEEVLESLGIAKNTQEKLKKSQETVKIPEKINKLYPQEQQAIINLLQEKEKLHIEELSERAGFDFSDLATILFELEIENVIESLPGKYYQVKK